MTEQYKERQRPIKLGNESANMTFVLEEIAKKKLRPPKKEKPEPPKKERKHIARRKLSDMTIQIGKLYDEGKTPAEIAKITGNFKFNVNQKIEVWKKYQEIPE